MKNSSHFRKSVATTAASLLCVGVLVSTLVSSLCMFIVSIGSKNVLSHGDFFGSLAIVWMLAMLFGLVLLYSGAKLSAAISADRSEDVAGGLKNAALGTLLPWFAIAFFLFLLMVGALYDDGASVVAIIVLALGLLGSKILIATGLSKSEPHVPAFRQVSLGYWGLLGGDIFLLIGYLTAKSSYTYYSGFSSTMLGINQHVFMIILSLVYLVFSIIATMGVYGAKASFIDYLSAEPSDENGDDNSGEETVVIIEEEL